MDIRSLSVLLVVIIPLVTAVWKSSLEDSRSGLRRGVHYHTKRHMPPGGGAEAKRRYVTQKPREARKKPSGHLKPLDEDDMENDEVVSVAVGPPPVRPKYDKAYWKHLPKKNKTAPPPNTVASTDLIKDILTQLGREFLTHQVSEDFVFGQYVGNAMKNLTSELRLSMQHEVLEIIVKYQRINRGEIKIEDKPEKNFAAPVLKDVTKTDKRALNDTDENWPDFSNLEKIVG